MDKVGFRIDDRARDDAAMLVYVLPHSDTCNKIHVLDCQGDVNHLEDIDAQIQEIGFGQWMEVVYPSYDQLAVKYFTKIFNKNVLNHKFVNYRAVDPLHIDKLMELRKQEIDYSTRAFDGVSRCHFIDGIAVLPGNFIIARAHNKTIDNPGFDMELGTNGLDKDLARDRLIAGAYYAPATARRVIETYLRSYIEVR